MKELTIEEKAKAYDEAIERAREMCVMPSDKATMEYVFHELKESEGKFEKPNSGIEEKPNGGIVLEDLSEGNGFYKVNLAYLSKEQVEEIGNIVKKWNPELESKDEKIRKDMLEYCYKRMNNEFPSITIHQVKRWLAYLEKVKNFDEELSKYYKQGYDYGYAEGIAFAKEQLEKSKPTPIDVDKMVSKYASTNESTTNSLPIICQLRAYRKGIYDALNISLNAEKKELGQIEFNPDDLAMFGYNK